MTTENPDNADWDLRSIEVQWGINNSKHRVTGYTPSDVVYRFQIASRVDNPLVNEVSKINKDKGTTNKEIDPTEVLRKHKEK